MHLSYWTELSINELIILNNRGLNIGLISFTPVRKLCII